MLNKNYQINYICEVNYPSTSAYALHVIKMCDSLSADNTKTNLIAPKISNNFLKLKKIYNLKNKFKLISIFNKKINMFFFTRIIFTIKILYLLRSKPKNIFLSRSIIFSLLSAMLGKKTILELHHELKGFSKILYNFVNFFKFDKNLKYIFIHKNLIKKFNLIKYKSLCLDDAIDINDYLVKFKSKILKKTCVYAGSFYPGKGLEIITYISKKLPDFNFHLYGDKAYLPSTSFEKNIHFFGHINYKEIPNILSKYEVALMPYLSKVSGRHKNLNLANNMSPLKMFDYLASGRIILATNLKVYGHILKNNYNAILVDENKIDDWIFWIKKIFKNPDKFSNLKKNSLITAKKYTWTSRGKKIKKFIVEKYF